MNYSLETVIPYRPMSSQRKIEVEETLRSSNSLLKIYSDRTKIKRAKLISMLLNGQRNFGGVSVPEEHAKTILETKRLEMEVLMAYSRLISKSARRWVNQSEVVFSPEDVFAESLSISLMAVIHYTDKVRFTTFLTTCIRNHLSRSFGKAKGISQDGIKLKRRYESLASKEGSTFDSVVEQMAISKKQTEVLKASLSKTKTMSEFSDSLHTEQKNHNIEPIDQTEMPSDDAEILKRVLRLVPLSRLEKIVVEAVMNSPA